MKHPHRVAPIIAHKMVAQLSERMQIVSLTEVEYLDTLRKAAEIGMSGPIIYDALLLACARKAKAKAIYTWNVRHFRAVAPDLAERIQEP